MSIPSSETPLYNHPLPDIEQWLMSMDCCQNCNEPHFWSVSRPNWQAEITLDTDQITVRYLGSGEDGKDIQRSFKYSLSRQDIEAAVFSGP
ncbi:MAG: DUF3143 domain-containing protein [Synechococcales bacterium]|nr:DUF3143 domain-containing protein [Cyanobacteria bacterium REEB444]MEB3126514.1 DUF3143 domain-containing protein [Synechococcales bacterium]